MRIASTISPPMRYSPAITGTIFSVTDAIREIPPIRITATSAASTSPVTQVGMPNAVLHVSAIELDCTIAPISPMETTVATAKNPAINLPNLPLNARWM